MADEDPLFANRRKRLAYYGSHISSRHPHVQYVFT